MIDFIISVKYVYLVACFICIHTARRITHLMYSAQYT